MSIHPLTASSVSTPNSAGAPSQPESRWTAFRGTVPSAIRSIPRHDTLTAGSVRPLHARSVAIAPDPPPPAIRPLRSGAGEDRSQAAGGLVRAFTRPSDSSGSDPLGIPSSAASE